MQEHGNMRMYYQLHNDEHINKFYGVLPEGSGFSTLPYRGWHNKYAAKPFGLPMPALTSSAASIGYAPNFEGLSQSTYNEQWRGPVNSIYEVQFSGFAPASASFKGACVDCNSMNKTVLVHQHTNISESYDIFNTSSDNFNRFISWKNNICDLDKYANLCGYYTVDFRLANSGVATENIRQNYFQATLNNGWSDQSLVFRKQLGNYRTDNVTWTTPLRLVSSSGLPLMLEGEHRLYPVLSQTNIASGDYSCDYSNAVCIVRPYKSNFYDVKNVLSNFSSGNNYYHLYKINGSVGTNDSLFPTACNNYQPNAGDYLTTGRNNSNYFPQFLNLSISGVTGNIDDKVCTPTNEYYNNKFKLSRYYEDGLSYPFQGLPDGYDNVYPITVTYSGGTATKYLWSGVDMYRKVGQPSDYTSNYSTNNNFHNICDFGCQGISTEDNRGFASGTCNNLIQLDIVYKSTPSTQKRMDAYLYLLGYQNSVSHPSSKIFYKNLCDDLDGRPCTNLVVDPTHANYSLGNVPCFSGTTWSNNWSLIPYSGGTSTILSGPTVITPRQDVFNTVNFTNSQPQIQPFTPNIPCRSLGCTVCDGDKIPQSISISATNPTTGVVTNYIIPIFTMGGGTNDFFNTPSRARVCYWGDDVADLQSAFDIGGFGTGIGNVTNPVIKMRIISDSIVQFALAVHNPAGTVAIFYTFNLTNTGGYWNFAVDCNSTVNTTSGNVASMTFADFINVQDYI